jgi:membrane associated rhomboid family serine protease
MAIYDREYVFNRKARRGLSVVAWLVIINTAIFVLGMFTTGMGRPVFWQESQLVSDLSQYRGPFVRDDTWRSVLGQGLSIDEAPREVRTRVGSAVGKFVIDRPTNTPVLVELYQVFEPLRAWGHFSTYQGFRRLEVWRLVTFQFLHADMLHLVLNMFGLWMFGRTTEEHLGGRKFLAFYLICGIAGGLLYMVLNGLGAISKEMGWADVPGLLYGTTVPLVGASAGVFGVIMAAAFLHPNETVFMPFPVKLRNLAWGYVILSVLALLFGARNAGGEAAHLGGAIAGFFFIRRQHLLRDFFAEFTDLKRWFQRKPRLKLAGTPAVRAPRPPPRQDPLPADLREEMDRILAKSSANGAESLTDEERATLRKATEAMNKARA